MVQLVCSSLSRWFLVRMSCSAYSLKSDYCHWTTVILTTMRFSLEWMNVFNMSVCVIHPERFMLWFLHSVSLCHCSFGTQRGGRRGCECITLEPSEMIVVSGTLHASPPVSAICSGLRLTEAGVQLGLGDTSKNSYLCIFWLICGIRHISRYFLCFCIWIKQIKWITIYYVKKGLKLHSNIVTLQSKNKNNAFKAEVIFTKLKMKMIKKAQTNWVKRQFWLPHYSHITVSAIIQIHLLVGLKFYICHIYCPTTNISAKCIF